MTFFLFSMLKPARAPILIDERPPAIHRTGSGAGVVHRTDRRRRSGSGAILKISMSPGFLVFWFFEIRAAPAPGVVHAAEQTRNRPGAIRSLWFIGSSIGRSASRRRNRAGVFSFLTSRRQCRKVPPALMEQEQEREQTRRRFISTGGAIRWNRPGASRRAPVPAAIIQTQRPPSRYCKNKKGF